MNAVGGICYAIMCSIRICLKVDSNSDFNPSKIILILSRFSEVL